MKWLDKLLGRNNEAPIEDDLNPSIPEVKADPETEAMLQATYEARDAFYKTLGKVDSDVIAPLINPAFMGGPSWPSLRQAWKVIRRPESIIIASDGLCDPFEDEKTPLGFRVEVCAEMVGTIENIAGSWLFDLVHQVSQNVAYHGGFDQLIERYETISTILPIPEAPSLFRNEKDEVGLIIGFPAKTIPKGFETPFGFVKLLVVTLLHPNELAFIESGEEMEILRKQLVAKLQKTKTAHLCVTDRLSVIE